MAENRLFNLSVPPVSMQPQPSGGEAPQPPAVGVITAPQSAITFAAAPATVAVVWQVLGSAIPWLADEKLFPIALSLVIGMLIYWQSAPVSTGKEKVLGFVFAFINSFAIAAATLGIDATITQRP